MEFKILFLVVLGLALGPASAKSPSVLRANILDIKKPETILFKFEKTSSTVGKEEVSKRKFVHPGGELAAEETVTYENGQLKKLELKQNQSGDSGSLEVKDGQLHFSYTRDGKTKTDEEKLEGELVSSDQMYTFLNANWDKLMKGETLSIRFPVLDRLETVGFKFFKEKDTDVNGVSAVTIKMKPSSFIIASLVNPIMFHFHPTQKLADGHKVIEVVGRTVPKTKDGEKWKDLDAIMRFEY